MASGRRAQGASRESKGAVLSERSESKGAVLSERRESKGAVLSERSESKGYFSRAFTAFQLMVFHQAPM